MNADADVERSIAHWLAEESPGRAPDRILANAGSVIDRTQQRRFAVAWREPVTISMRGLALVAAFVVIVVIGAGFVGRSTATVGTQASPSPEQTVASGPTAHVATLAEYKAARDAICAALFRQSIPPDVDPVTDPNGEIAVLQTVIARGTSEINQLSALDVPPEMMADNVEALQVGKDTIALIQHMVDLIHDGKADQIGVVDQATAPLSAQGEAFERKYGLAPCP